MSVGCNICGEIGHVGSNCPNDDLRKDTCKNCIYYLDLTDLHGYCRFNAPTYIDVNQKWVYVAEHDWCGQYKPKRNV